MPGVFRRNVRDLVRECRALAKLGVPAGALFPKLAPALKDEEGTQALHEDTLVLRAVRAVNPLISVKTMVSVRVAMLTISPFAVSMIAQLA